MKEEAWRKCATPCAQATEDPERFLQHYFHTNGAPDRVKAPKPLILNDFRMRAKLKQYTKKIPGLHVCSGGREYDFVVCIGWDLNAVNETAEQSTHDFALKRAERRKARTESDLKRHRDVVDKMKWNIDTTKLTKEDKLWRAYGTYVVQCDNLLSAEEDWGFGFAIEHHTSPGLLQAEVEFGEITGQMLFSFSKSYLDSYVEKSAFPKQDFEESDSDDYSDPDVEAPEMDDTALVPGTRKRKSASRQPRRGKERGGRQKKNKKKVSWGTPNRLYIRFRGRDEDWKYYQTKGGFLDFLDDKCLEFKGVCMVGRDGREVSFGGFKTWEYSLNTVIKWPCPWWGTYDTERIDNPR